MSTGSLNIIEPAGRVTMLCPPKVNVFAEEGSIALSFLRTAMFAALIVNGCIPNSFVKMTRTVLPPTDMCIIWRYVVGTEIAVVFRSPSGAAAHVPTHAPVGVDVLADVNAKASGAKNVQVQINANSGRFARTHAQTSRISFLNCLNDSHFDACIANGPYLICREFAVGNDVVDFSRPHDEREASAVELT